VVANGASMQMVEGSIPTAPRSSYNGSCSDHGLEGNLVKLLLPNTKHTKHTKHETFFSGRLLTQIRIGFPMDSKMVQKRVKVCGFNSTQEQSDSDNRTLDSFLVWARTTKPTDAKNKSYMP
jgi:hypothetical protein